MQSLIESTLMNRGGELRPAGSRRGRDVRLVEFSGLLPAQPASFLARLPNFEKRDVYVILGTFKEVRGLAGAARLLHLFLKEGPFAAARGRTTFREFLDEKDEILRDISALREKVNRAAENVRLILPRVPQLRIEEVRRDDAAYLRVS
jgi:hypothetical protein